MILIASWPSKWKKNRKCKKTIKFGNIRKGIYIKMLEKNDLFINKYSFQRDAI